MILPEPTKPPTGSEYAVIVWLIAGLLMAFGIAAFVIGFRAPPQKHGVAIALEHCALWSFGLGVGIGAIYLLFRRLTD